MEPLPQSTERGRTFLLPCSYKNKRKRDLLDEKYRSVGDHISKLPDDILVIILSCLTMKEAVRTSIISSRWRYLWRGFTGCLNSDDPLTMADLADLKWSDLNLKSEPLNVERHKFVHWVNQVLRSLEGHCMEELRICFDVAPYGNIDDWIKFAIEKRVQRLELDLSRVDYTSWSVGQYAFTSNLDFYSSFNYLTALNLTTVAITGEIIEHLLSYYCPALEVLCVAESSILTSLKVSGPSLKLKHLKLESLNNLKDLELHAPNLLSFEYSGLVVPISFKYIPNLVEVSFRSFLSDCIVDNLCHHPSFPVPVGPLHTLKLDFSLFYVYGASDYCYNIPEFCNLKHLEIIGKPDVNCLLLCVAFFKASPSLFKFKLKLDQSLGSWYRSKTTIKDHPYLSFTEFRSVRVVELLGFVGHAADLEFVMYLIESAKLLEKIIIDPCMIYWVGTPWEFSCRESKEYLSARRRAIELAAKFPLWEFLIP